jgi:HEAT repeat protein
MLLQENAFGQNMPTITTPTQTNVTDHKIEYYLAKEDWDSLAKLGQPAIPRLVAALSDNDILVRRGAIGALGRIGDRSIIEPLVAVMKDHNSRVQQEAAETLVTLGYAPESIDDQVTLRLAIPNDKSMEELAKMGQKAVVPLCKRLRELKANKSYGIAVFVVRTLGKIGDTNIADTLIAVADGQDWIASGYMNVAGTCPLTCAAVTVLGKIHDLKAVDPLIKLLSSCYRGDGLSESSNHYNDVIESCAVALGELGDPRAAVPLGKCLMCYRRNQYDTDSRLAVCDALVKLGTVSVEPLIKALSTAGIPAQRAETHWMATHALGKIGDKRAVQPLCDMLNDEYEASNVRQEVAFTLGKLKDQRAIDPLIRALKDSDSGVRASATKALDELGWKP